MADIYKNGELVQHQNNACIPNINWMIQAGMDPKTGLPKKYTAADDLKGNIRKLIRIQDEQDAINCFEWYNLPEGITGEELERLLYYKGQLCFFYHEGLDQFFFMPYALDGSIDFYGRFNSIHPVPMFNGTTEEEKKLYAKQAEYLSTLKLKVIHDIKLDEIKPEDITGSAVILRDYTNQMSQTIIPRQQLQEGIIDIESDIPCYLRTALKNSTGVQGMRVNDESAYTNVLAANKSLDDAAINGQRLIPIISTIEMQDLSGGEVLKAEEYLESLQSIDNLRLGFHGIENGGLFQKKSHMLQDEQDMNMGKANSALQDRQWNRQHFCDIVNSYTGLGIWCEPKENALGADMNMDGQENSDEGPDDKSYGGSEESTDEN